MTRDDTDGDTTPVRNRFDRRSLLLALGAGSALTLTGPYGSASAQEGDGTDDDVGDDDTGGDGGDDDRRCPPCIDSYSGYLQAAEVKGEQPLGRIDPVTTVELQIADVDVIFPDEGGPGAETPATETPETETPANATELEETPTGTPLNETVNATTETPVPGTDTGNETDEANETDVANETVAGETEAGAETETPVGEPQGMPDFFFDPVAIHVQPGDTVEFVVGEGLHTVTAFHPRFGLQRRVPEGVPGFTSPPVTADDSWYYRFDESGVYDILCIPHHGLGMAMRAVVVDDESEAIPEATPLPGPDEPELELPEIEANVLSAPELDPQNVVEQGSVQWSELSDVGFES